MAFFLFLLWMHLVIFSRSSKKNLVDKVIKWPWHVCEITKSILTFIAQKRYTFKLTLNDMFSFQREIDEWIKKVLHI